MLHFRDYAEHSKRTEEKNRTWHKVKCGGPREGEGLNNSSITSRRTLKGVVVVHNSIPRCKTNLKEAWKTCSQLSKMIIIPGRQNMGQDRKQ